MLEAWVLELLPRYETKRPTSLSVVQRRVERADGKIGTLVGSKERGVCFFFGGRGEGAG